MKQFAINFANSDETFVVNIEGHEFNDVQISRLSMDIMELVMKHRRDRVNKNYVKGYSDNGHQTDRSFNMEDR